MNRAVKCFALGVVLLFASALGFLAGRLSVSHPPPRFPECSVVGVVDGDTLIVRYEWPHPTTEGVRLLCIDTPEREEPGFEEAKAALSRLVEGRRIRLEFETIGQPQRDRYGRILAYVFADDLNINVEMVRQGWTPFWTKYGRGRYAEDFESAEAEAHAAGRGLWADEKR